jgi:hypothetical protein
MTDQPYRFLIYDVLLERAGEPIYFVPTSDKHLESATCDRDALKKFYRALDNSPHKVAYVDVGDASDLILPGDLKRFTASSSDLMAGHDARLNATRDHLVDFEKGRKWLCRLAGNHEHAVLKRHSYNLLGDTCAALKHKTDWIKLANPIEGESAHSCSAIHSGKCRIRLRFRTKSRGKSKYERRGSLDIFLIHGRWGGQVIKGLGGAHRMYATMHGVRLFCFGHGHSAIVDKVARDYATDAGRIDRQDCYVMQCGTWKRSDQSGVQTYSVNYPPVSIGNPVVRITPRVNSIDISPVLGGFEAWL